MEQPFEIQPEVAEKLSGLSHNHELAVKCWISPVVVILRADTCNCRQPMAKHIPRLYLEKMGQDVVFEVDGEQGRRMLQVLRTKKGEQFLAFNAAQGEWLCSVEERGKGAFIARKIELKRVAKTGQEPRLCLAFCPIKHDRQRMLIEKSTELGVTDFFPIRCVYCSAFANLHKLRETAICAVEQSERLEIPTFHEERPLLDFINSAPKDVAWFSAIERHQRAVPLVDIDVNIKARGFIIGPEGGFSADEKAALAAKTTPISFSQNILRSETAGIACIAISKAVQML